MRHQRSYVTYSVLFLMMPCSFLTYFTVLWFGWLVTTLSSWLETEKFRKLVAIAGSLWEEKCRVPFLVGCRSIDLLDSFCSVKVGHTCWGHVARMQTRFPLQSMYIDVGWVCLWQMLSQGEKQKEFHCVWILCIQSLDFRESQLQQFPAILNPENLSCFYSRYQ